VRISNNIQHSTMTMAIIYTTFATAESNYIAFTLQQLPVCVMANELRKQA